LAACTMSADRQRTVLMHLVSRSAAAIALIVRAKRRRAPEEEANARAGFRIWAGGRVVDPLTLGQAKNKKKGGGAGAGVPRAAAQAQAACTDFKIRKMHGVPGSRSRGSAATGFCCSPQVRLAKSQR
jgi:hypothetical protein